MTDSKLSDNVRSASKQQQFLDVISREEATQRFHAHLNLKPLGSECIQLNNAHGRVLSEDIQANIDVPGFDRSNVDGFAVIAADIVGAMEESPRELKINNESLLPGEQPQISVTPGTASPVSTGGMIPRGADAVVMIEDTDLREEQGFATLEISRSVHSGNMITFAGTDIAKGETILWSGTRMTSREIGVLASLGLVETSVFRQPSVAIISTGDEVVAPGEPLPIGSIYDSNAAILAGAVSECGGNSVFIGRVKDDLQELQKLVTAALDYDIVLLSGGTSKGAGDISYHVVQKFDDPGIVAHGVALKPGKPICMAVTAGKPVVILPGFPTSAIFTFHEFVAPVIRSLAGQPNRERRSLSATLPMRINSGRGRTEYLLVRIFESNGERYAYPMGKGSGSVTTFSLADGFITIPQNCEILDSGSAVEVTLLDQELHPSDLVVIGSHCVGLDFLLSELHRSGVKTSAMYVGSEAGLAAVQRGECHIAGIHLLDRGTNSYNTPFLSEELELIQGYRRMQCFVSRKNDGRYSGLDATSAIQRAISDPACTMVNRNSGSGTRILTDQLFETCNVGSAKPNGYSMQVKSHNAVAAAISQDRADWGIAIESVANTYELNAIPIREEHFDFVVRKELLDRSEIIQFQELLERSETQEKLRNLGFQS